jgi:hypothetical protein
LFAPAWRAAGVRLDRLLVTRESATEAGSGTDRATESFWALEQSLQSGACSLCIAWQERASMTQLRRLALAAGRGAALGVLIRPLRALAMPTAAVLRLTLRRTATHLRLELVKGRGIAPRSIELALP